MMWLELWRMQMGLSRYATDNKTRQIVRRDAKNPEWFEAYYVRQLHKGIHPPYEETIQLWPLQPVRRHTAQEAVNAARTLLEIAASGKQDELFEKRPVPMPLHLKEVSEVASPTHEAKAILYRDSDTRYEVCYFVDFVGSEEHGWRVGVPSPDNKSVPTGFGWRRFANTLRDAEYIASEELAKIVSGRHDIVPLQNLKADAVALARGVQ